MSNKIDKIDLSHLELKEIEIISERPLILVLDKNKITKIDNLISQKQLQQLSIAYNQIIQLNGLNTLADLTVLNLSYNNIISIDGLKTLTKLTWLNLSNNRIKNIEHLESNLQLKHLDLSDNHISKITKITFLLKLKTFLLHGNYLTNLDKFGMFLPSSIEILSLAENRIYDLSEICHLSQLQNLKQLSIKENPCVNPENKDMKFDYRPFIVNWCLNLRILDGEEISEKERLIAEWLYTQGKGRSFKPGYHFELINYLTNECALTDIKNRSKLNNVLDNVLKQRRQHSSRRIYKYSTNSKLSTENLSDASSSRVDDSSCNVDFTDLNESRNTRDEENSAVNTSMLMSESSFLPISPQNPNQNSAATRRSLSPIQTDQSQVSDSTTVPMLRYSKEPPKVSRKSSTKSVLSSSIGRSSILASSFIVNRDDEFKENQAIVEHPQSNNNAILDKRPSNIPLHYIIRIQAWWRGIFTRSKNPIIRKYLSNREGHRTRSHILFLQRQMQLYYESYEQQRKLNATQSQAITFLIEQIQEISQWKESVIKSETLQLSTNTVIGKELQSTQSQTEIDSIERQCFLDKITNLQDQVSSLRETVWKLEHTVQRTLQTNDDKTISDATDQLSEHSYSEESDLNKVMFEAERMLDRKVEDSLSCTLSEIVVLMSEKDNVNGNPSEIDGDYSGEKTDSTQ